MAVHASSAPRYRWVWLQKKQKLVLMIAQSRKSAARPDSPIPVAKIPLALDKSTILLWSSLRLMTDLTDWMNHLWIYFAAFDKQLYLHDMSPIDLGPALAAAMAKENMNR